MATILLLEDDPILQETMTAMLQTAGHRVIVAGDLTTARDAAGDEIEVLIVDRHLPTGADEDVDADTVVAKCPGARIVFVSGDGHALDDERLRSIAGDRPHTALTKPFSMQELLASVAGA